MAKLIVVTNELGSFATNCYMVANTETRETIVIDPAWDAKYIFNTLEHENLKCVAIYLTHGHVDHMAALEELVKLTGVQVYAAQDEKEVLESTKANLSEMLWKPVTVTADKYLQDGDVVKVLGTELHCISVPGHTRGGMCYYFPEEKLLFSGDTLFAGSVGRSDFPTGDGAALVENIREKLLTLPEDTIVYPGHNGHTKIKREKETNPFF